MDASPIRFHLIPTRPSDLKAYLYEDAHYPDVGYKVNLEEFASQLKHLWSDAYVYIMGSYLEWELPDSSIIGKVENDYFVGFQSDSIERQLAFINWYRQFVPTEFDIYLFHFGSLSEYTVIEAGEIATASIFNLF